MREKQISDLLNETNLPVNHPFFFSRIFSLLAKQQQVNRAAKNDTIEKVIKADYDELSRRLDRSAIQESCSVRNILKTRRLALLLIDNQGELRTTLLPEFINLLKTHLYSLGPNRQYDAIRQEQILKVLQLLHQNKDLVRLLKKIGKPFSHKQAEQIIRDTLQLPENIPVTDAQARRAALSAWMCYLRQNIGSCFATAPAVIIHDEQAERFLMDLDELLSTGRLKRTFGGVEYAVPLSPSWGGGDLKKPILMREISQNNWFPEVWFSPGLLAAFTESGSLEKNASLKHKIAQIKAWVLELLDKEKKYSPYLMLTAESLIRHVLLKQFSLTEKDLEEYQNRQQTMRQTNLVMQIPKSAKGGIGEACVKFVQTLSRAHNAFKALADNALLKSWEFTLASFTETKANFTQWNLYSSLGLGPQDPGGIGQCLYEILKKKVDSFNQKAQDIQYEYELVYNQLQMTEARIRTAASEQELQWIKAEYQSRRHEFNTLQEIRDTNTDKARRFANLFDVIINHYLSLFRDYFQEVYDADMHDVVAGPFDDSPAGFRLLYKHGRSNTSQWTRIHTPTEFIESLSSFFIATEPHIAADDSLSGLDREFSDIVTAIVTHIKTPEFLDSAFHRMAAAHQTASIKDPLKHLERIEKKPWAYTSGGSMSTLICSYYRRDDKPTETERWMENETDLCTFLIDTIKKMPPVDIDPFLKGSRSSMLIHSPTHAFLLKPAILLKKDGFLHDLNTYIWIRDHIIKPSQDFVDSITLEEDMMHFLVEQLLDKVPFSYHHFFKKAFSHIYGRMNPWEFRQYLVNEMESNRSLNIRGTPILFPDEIDSLLYSQIPLFRVDDLKNRLEQVFFHLPGIHKDTVAYLIELFDQISLDTGQHRIMGSNHLQDICKAILCLAAQSTSKAINYHLHVSETVQKLGFGMPAPMLFADTNWTKDFFGFVINPGTTNLELWRLDCTGTVGVPMSAWKQWVDGSAQNPKWGVYVKPSEYGQG